MARSEFPATADDRYSDVAISYAGGDTALVSPMMYQILKEASGRQVRQPIINLDFETTDAGWRTGDPAMDHLHYVMSADLERTFRDWGPKRYPVERYETPASVRRGFEAHLDSTRGKPAPAPKRTFHVEPSRYSSREGRAFDMQGMFADMKAAERRGEIVSYPVEMPVTSKMDADMIWAAYDRTK